MKTLKQRWLLLGMLLICAAAIFDTVKLTHHHYDFLAGTSTAKAFCNISNLLNCDAVTASPFAELGGIAISSLGLGLYLFFIFLIIGWLSWLSKHAGSAAENKQPLSGSLLYLLSGVEILHSIFL